MAKKKEAPKKPVKEGLELLAANREKAIKKIVKRRVRAGV